MGTSIFYPRNSGKGWYLLGLLRLGHRQDGKMGPGFGEVNGGFKTYRALFTANEDF